MIWLRGIDEEDPYNNSLFINDCSNLIIQGWPSSDLELTYRARFLLGDIGDYTFLSQAKQLKI